MCPVAGLVLFLGLCLAAAFAINAGDDGLTRFWTRVAALVGVFPNTEYDTNAEEEVTSWEIVGWFFEAVAVWGVPEAINSLVMHTIVQSATKEELAGQTWRDKLGWFGFLPYLATFGCVCLLLRRRIELPDGTVKRVRPSTPFIGRVFFWLILIGLALAAGWFGFQREPVLAQFFSWSKSTPLIEEVRDFRASRIAVHPDEPETRWTEWLFDLDLTPERTKYPFPVMLKVELKSSAKKDYVVGVSSIRAADSSEDEEDVTVFRQSGEWKALIVEKDNLRKKWVAIVRLRRRDADQPVVKQPTDVAKIGIHAWRPYDATLPNRK